MDFNFFDFIALLGGLGLFLFGMKMMGEGLEKTAGEKLQNLIERMTGKLFKGVLVGAFVTAIVQSSSATTVMVVGFVNAGIMKLTNAVGVIMGANIGTTVTAQILRLGDIDKGMWYIQILKPKTLAPLVVAIGVAMIFFSKRKKYRNIGEILAGFGILFIGMSTMEDAVKVLRDLPAFEQAFIKFGDHPILGILAGAIVTALIQSSSASVGILQAVAAATGLVTYASAIPIILGQNIGTCVTALLSSIGANKNAKRAAIIHLLFNLIGSIVFIALIYIIQKTIGFGFWDDVAGRGGIANFHTAFNIANTILLLPFAGILVSTANKIVKGKKDKDSKFSLLDNRLLATPSAAVNAAVKEINEMFASVRKMYSASIGGLFTGSSDKINEVMEYENHIDETESAVTNYLVKIVEGTLSNDENKVVSGMFHVITDIERIGGHCVNIAETTKYLEENGIDFSASAINELHYMTELCGKMIELSYESFIKKDIQKAKTIQPIEDVVDLMKETFRVKHIERISNKECDFKAGVVFLDIVANLERISDHCSNIGIAVEDSFNKNDSIDPHQYMKQIHKDRTPDYMKIYDKYLEENKEVL